MIEKEIKSLEEFARVDEKNLLDYHSSLPGAGQEPAAEKDAFERWVQLRNQRNRLRLPGLNTALAEANDKARPIMEICNQAQQLKSSIDAATQECIEKEEEFRSCMAFTRVSHLLHAIVPRRDLPLNPAWPTPRI